MLSWEFTRKGGSDVKRCRQTERGRKVQMLKGRRMHIRGWRGADSVEKWSINEGVAAGDGAESPLTAGGNSLSETTLTRCGQQLSSCCFCLICFPPQYVWYACHFLSGWHSKIYLGSYRVKKYESCIVVSELPNVKGKKDRETAAKLAEKMLTQQKKIWASWIVGLSLFRI